MPGRYRSVLGRVLLLTGVILAGCDSAGLVGVAPEPEAEGAPFSAFSPAFRPYVARFVAEAQARGVGLDVSALTVEFTPTIHRSGKAYCGYALNFGTDDPPRVQISLQEGCWADQSDLNKEILLFHELGHALLNRAHSHKKLPSGSWGSIMFDGNQFGLYTEHTLGKRAYYLDELFAEETPVPEWGHRKTNREQLLGNTGFEARGEAWSFAALPPENRDEYRGRWAGEQALSPGYALGISREREVADHGSFAYWQQTVPAKSYPLGARLRLAGKLRLDGVEGEGVALSVRATRPGSEAVLFFTTYAALTITGSHDFTEYALDLDYPEGFETISVFLLLMNNTTGTVYFDDVTLTAQY